MSKAKILFVINPKAGVGNQSKVPELIEKHLDKNLFDFEILYTQHPKHAAQLADLGLLDGISIIAAVGGDGTVNEVARNTINNNYTLAIIPAGSGNGLARHLKIPLDPVKAIQRLNSAEIFKIDSAKIQNYIFLNVAGTGFDALVSSKFAKNKKRGFINYAKIAINSFKNYHCSDYEIDIDGKKLKTSAFLVAFANSSQYGNNAFIAPAASIEDGELTICILNKFRWYQAPMIAYHLFNKTLNNTNYVLYYSGRSIKVQHQEKFIHYDGEPMEAVNPFHVEVNPKSINIMK